MESKPTLANPKDIIGAKKLPLNVVPDMVRILATMSFTEGALKYGAYNWRASGVSASIYAAALGRHLMKWWNGEEADKRTKVPHLASIIACATIIADARACGMLTDDRPPPLDIEVEIVKAEEVVEHLAEMFKAMNPHHYSIQDPQFTAKLNGETVMQGPAGRIVSSGVDSEGIIPEGPTISEFVTAACGTMREY